MAIVYAAKIIIRKDKKKTEVRRQQTADRKPQTAEILKLQEIDNIFFSALSVYKSVCMVEHSDP